MEASSPPGEEKPALTIRERAFVMLLATGVILVVVISIVLLLPSAI